MKFSLKDNINIIKKVKAERKKIVLVIIFEELTPENLIKEIVPDVLVKGGDYNIKDIVGFQTVIQNGGIVKSLSFYDGYSTTNYINKINKP